MGIADPGRGGEVLLSTLRRVQGLLGPVTRKEANVNVGFGMSMVSENSVSKSTSL